VYSFWFTHDDANRISTFLMQRFINAVKSIDSNNPTSVSCYRSPMGSNYSGNHFNRVFRFTDLPHLQSYPIFPGFTIDHVYNNTLWCKYYAEANNKPFIMDLQIFDWSAFGHQGCRWPRPKEVDIMSYLTITGGAKGIQYYSFSDDSDP
jgi:hypothetical protein